MKTPFAEGARIHYNFVKPHEALEGQTPAEVAGMGIRAGIVDGIALSERDSAHGEGGASAQSGG